MKKCTALICLLLTLTLLGGALADSGNVTLFSNEQKTQMSMENDYCTSMAVANDTVYTLWSTSICAWKEGQDLPQTVATGLTQDYYNSYDEAKEQVGDVADSLIYKLVSDGTTLYGLNRHTGKLFPLTFADGKLTEGTPVQLDWKDIEVTPSADSDNYRDIIRVLISEGKLYLLVRDYQNYDQPILYCFDLASGARQDLKVPTMQDLYPYKDGKMLAYLFDSSNAYSDDGTLKNHPVLAVMNPADSSTETVATLPDTNCFGFSYQAATDTLYYTDNNQVMSMQAFGQPAMVAYMPASYTDTADVALLSDGKYVLNSWDGLNVRSTDPQYLPTSTLAVYSGNLDDSTTTFIAQNPQVAVTFNQSVYFNTAEQLAQSMTSGDSTFDIFNVDLSYQDFQSLLNKGYCMDLSGSAKITEEMGKMYPFLQTPVQKDGKYYAIPTSLYAYGFSIVPQAWEKAGISDKVPTSFMGLIDFLNWWLDEGESAHPDLQLMDQVTDFRQTLFEMALNMYVTDCQANGQDLSLNTPVFKEMLTALDSLDTDALNDTLPATDDNATSGRVMMDGDDGTLFTNYGDWLNIYDNGGYVYNKPLILSLEDGGAQHIPVYVSVVFINPNTKNPDMAVKYLENMLDHMDKAQHIMMFPDDNNPIPVQNYDKMVADWQTNLDKQKEVIKTAKPEDVKDIQATIDNLQDLLTNKDKYRWQVSQDGINQYRAIAPLCFTATPNLINLNANNGDSDISTLITRYLQKQVSLDQFLNDADQKIRMIQMERQ